MDPVVLGFFVAVVVNAAAGNDDDISASFHMEVIVYQVVDTAVAHTGGDEHGFTLGFAGNKDVDSGFHDLGFDANVLGGLTAVAFTVHTDIVSASQFSVEIGDLAQQLFSDLIR